MKNVDHIKLAMGDKKPDFEPCCNEPDIQEQDNMSEPMFCCANCGEHHCTPVDDKLLNLLVEKVNRLEEDLRLSNLETEIQKTTIEVLNDENSRLKEDLDIANKKVIELEQQVSSLEDDVENTECSVESLEGEIDALQAEVDNLTEGE